MDCIVHGILQARILEWVAVLFSSGSSQTRDRTQHSHIAEYWSGLQFHTPGDLPGPGINQGLLHCRWILHHMSHQGSPFIV